MELHIEELVLDGFVPDERHRIAEAVERTLTRLLTEQGAPPSLAQDGAVARLDGGTFEVPPGSRPEAIGAQVAQAIYRGVTR